MLFAAALVLPGVFVVVVSLLDAVLPMGPRFERFASQVRSANSGLLGGCFTGLFLMQAWIFALVPVIYWGKVGWILSGPGMAWFLRFIWKTQDERVGDELERNVFRVAACISVVLLAGWLLSEHERDAEHDRDAEPPERRIEQSLRS